MLTSFRKNACSTVEHTFVCARFTKADLPRGSEGFAGNVFVVEARAIDTNNR